MSQPFTGSTDGNDIAITAGTDPALVERVHGPSWSPTTVLVINESTLTTQRVCNADTFLVDGVQYKWTVGASTSAPNKAITGVTSGAYVQQTATTFGPFSSVAAFRAATPPSVDTECSIEGVGRGIYKPGSGANTIDDGLYVIKPTSVATSSNGRFFLRQAATVGTVIATVEDGGSATTLWSQDVAAASVVEVEANLALFSGATAGTAAKIAKGTIACVAHRHGSGSLAIDSQVTGVPWVLTDSNWNPVFDTSSNTLRLRITPDTVQKIDGTVAVTVKTTDTSGTQAPDQTPLEIARAAVLADAPGGLWYSDVGLTPSSPSAGTDITAWADQSGNARHLSATTGNEPAYQLESSTPSLLYAAAGGDMMAASFAPAHDQSMTVRWTSKKTDNATASKELVFFFGTNRYVFMHSGLTFNSDGTNIMMWDGGTMRLLGACPTGKHDFELRMNHDTLQATLYIDGVAGTPVTYAETGTLTAFRVGYDGSTTFALSASIYGVAFQQSLGTDTQMNHWITMSQLAWGAHD